MQWSMWHTVGACIAFTALLLYTQLKLNMGAFMRARSARSDPSMTADGLRAIRVCERVPSVFGWPKTGEKWIVHAQLLAQAGRTDEAAGVCARLMRRTHSQQQRAELFLTMAECYDREWRIDEAISATETAIAIMRDAGGGGASALIAQAKVASLKGDARGAALLGSRAATQLAASMAKVEPLLAEVTVGSAKLMELTALGKADEAVELARKVPQSALAGPFGSPLASAAAAAYLHAGLPSEARALVVHIDGQASQTRVLMAVAMAEGDYEGALALDLPLGDDTGPDPNALDQRLHALGCLGRFEEAVEAAGSTLASDCVGQVVGRRNLGAVLLNSTAEMLLELGRRDDARTCLRSVIDMPGVSHPTLARAHANLARAAAVGEESQTLAAAAEEMVCTQIEQGSRPVAAVLSLGRALLEVGRAESAVEYLSMVDELTRHASHRHAASYYRSLALAALGREAEAQDLLEQVAHGLDQHWLTHKARDERAATGRCAL